MRPWATLVENGLVEVSLILTIPVITNGRALPMPLLQPHVPGGASWPLGEAAKSFQK